MLSRKNARENLFILIFEKSFNNDTAEEILDTAISVRDFEVDDYIKSAFLGIDNNLDEIDNIIISSLKGWTIDRLSKVSLAILRISIAQMLYMKDIPVGVVINEAVELSKHFGDSDDYQFINGSLSKIEKTIL